MDKKYSITEILTAVEDLNKIKKNITNKIIQTKKTKVDNRGIPPSTLKLIEEAENN